MTLSLVEIQRAAITLKDVVLRTPLIKSPYLSQLIEGGVYLKLENLQLTGSFTPRGIYIKLLQLIIVPESGIEAFVDLLAVQQKIIAESAGTAGVTTLLQEKAKFHGKKVAVVICGGNMDSRVLSSVLMGGLVHRHQLIQLKVEIADASGTLNQVSKTIGRYQGSIIEIYHQRLFNGRIVKMSDLDILVESRDRNHGDEIGAALKNGGFPTQAEYL